MVEELFARLSPPETFLPFSRTYSFTPSPHATYVHPYRLIPFLPSSLTLQYLSLSLLLTCQPHFHNFRSSLPIRSSYSSSILLSHFIPFSCLLLLHPLLFHSYFPQYISSVNSSTRIISPLPASTFSLILTSSSPSLSPLSISHSLTFFHRPFSFTLYPSLSRSPSPTFPHTIFKPEEFIK